MPVKPQKDDLFSELLRQLESGHPNRVVAPFVRKHGQLYQAREFPKCYRRGKIGVCFANSYRMANRHKLTYVEGYAINEITSHPVLHAWCIDDQNRVLDPTWRTALLYFGIPFRIEYLRKVIAERKERLGDEHYYGLLDDWQSSHPLINTLGDKPAVWLAEGQITSTSKSAPESRPGRS